MIPSLDLLLGTIERALAVTILPNATNASAKEEASLALLFTRWLRDVVDDVAAAERVSALDCRAVLAEVTALLEKDPSGRRALDAIHEARVAPLDDATPQAAVREEGRKMRMLLGRVLRALRDERQAELAGDVRGLLYDLGIREIERERSYGRASAMDPDWQKLPRLADLRKELR